MDYEPDERPPIQWTEKEKSINNTIGKCFCISGLLFSSVGVACMLYGSIIEFSNSSGRTYGYFEIAFLLLAFGSGMLNTIAVIIGSFEHLRGRGVTSWWTMSIVIACTIFAGGLVM